MKKGDKISVIILALLIIISSVGVCTYLIKSKNNHPVAVIKQDGKEIQRIDLKEIKEPKEWKIYDDNGNYNTISVEPDRISIIDADCRDKLCVKFGWLSRSGQTAEVDTITGATTTSKGWVQSGERALEKAKNKH